MRIIIIIIIIIITIIRIIIPLATLIGVRRNAAPSAI
jgi:hypothetical protein